MRLVVVSWPPDHGDDAVGDDFVFGQPVAVDFGREQRIDQAFLRMLALLGDSIAEIFGHLRHALQHSRIAFRIVLEISQHLGEIRRPFFELNVIARGNAHQLGRNDRRQRLGNLGNDVDLFLALQSVEQALDDVLDVAA